MVPKYGAQLICAYFFLVQISVVLAAPSSGHPAHTNLLCPLDVYTSASSDRRQDSRTLGLLLARLQVAQCFAESEGSSCMDDTAVMDWAISFTQ